MISDRFPTEMRSPGLRVKDSEFLARNPKHPKHVGFMWSKVASRNHASGLPGVVTRGSGRRRGCGKSSLHDGAGLQQSCGSIDTGSQKSGAPY